MTYSLSKCGFQVIDSPSLAPTLVMVQVSLFCCLCLGRTQAEAVPGIERSKSLHQSFSSNRWCGHSKQTDVLEVAPTWTGQLYVVAPAAPAVYVSVSVLQNVREQVIREQGKILEVQCVWFSMILLCVRLPSSNIRTKALLSNQYVVPDFEFCQSISELVVDSTFSRVCLRP